MSRFPKSSENNTTLGEAWVTLTTVATPSHTPVQQLTTPIAQREKNQSNVQVINCDIDPDSYGPDHCLHLKQDGLTTECSGLSGDPSNEHLHKEPAIRGQGSGHLSNECVRDLSKKVGIDSSYIPSSGSGINAAKSPTRIIHQTSSQVPPKHSLLKPNHHLHPLQHAYSDNDIRIASSVQTLMDSPPSSPGKLAMKYMEHLDSHTSPSSGRHNSVKSNQNNSRKQGTDLFAPLSESQRRLAASPAKATALVAPYVGGSDTSTQIQNRHKTLESRLPLSGKFNSMSISSSTNTGSKYLIDELVGRIPLVQAQSLSADKWKSLVETKDHILSQKNHLIERLVYDESVLYR